jgi:hypothetical protein
MGVWVNMGILIVNVGVLRVKSGFMIGNVGILIGILSFLILNSLISLSNDKKIPYFQL